jgi:hypothetical protein
VFLPIRHGVWVPARRSLCSLVRDDEDAALSG